MSAQDSPERLRIAFYNVENLFDPTNDSLKNDDEYTPEGSRFWSDYRYREKSNHIAKAILSIGEWQAVDIIGLAEVENRKVVEDLTQSEVLRKFSYDIIHFESPDRRGIDVAVLYRSDKLELLKAENITVKLEGDPNFATRDMVYAKFKTASSDTLHIFYCHWPSRYGGQAKSEPKRIAAAQALREVVDSLFLHSINPQIIVAGDLNDEWHNESVKEVLCPAADPKNALINLMENMDQNEGSHRYRGVWSYLDQVLVSTSLLDKEKLDVKDQTAHVSVHSFLLEKDERFPGLKPFRSFNGLTYQGGFSDHLPVYIDLIGF